jgi:hypothetical protein
MNSVLNSTVYEPSAPQFIFMLVPIKGIAESKSKPILNLLLHIANFFSRNCMPTFCFYLQCVKVSIKYSER